MEDVRFYDLEFRLLHIEHAIFSCNWTFYENDIGQFEMHFPLESRLSRVAAENPYMVAVQGDKQAIITGRQLTEEGIVYGRSCNWILTRFCFGDNLDTDKLFEEGTLTGKDPQTVCRYLLNETVDGIENFVFRDCEKNLGEVLLQYDTVQSVYLLVQECMKQVGGGHGVYFDVRNKKWELFLTKGEELAIVLSEDNRNSYQTEYTEDWQEFFSGGYYLQSMEDMGEWDVYSNEPRLMELEPENYAKGYRVLFNFDSSGIKEYERFGISFFEGDYIVCDDKSGKWKKASNIYDFYVKISPSSDQQYPWITFLDGENEAEAIEDLQKKTVSKQFKVVTEAFLFGRDYRLGDSVRLQVKKGSFDFCDRRKITGVNIWYEENSIGEQPIFEE